jgi:hypothetical protein
LLTVALNTITLIINGKFKVNSTTQTGVYISPGRDSNS